MAQYIGVNGTLYPKDTAPEDAPQDAPVQPQQASQARRPRPTLAPQAPPTPQRKQVVTVASLLAGGLIALALIALVSRTVPMVQPAARDTNAPQATPAPTPRPQPSATPAATLPRALVAWDAPQGHVLGALTAGGVYTATARYGSDWLQIDAGSGPVWVQAVELGQAVAPELVDLAPPPTATPRPYVAPTAPAYVPPPQPTADLRPVQCVTTIYGQECSKDLDPNDQRVVQEIEAKSKAYNAGWFATATAQAQR